jgi:hypothetical protein
VAIFFRNGAAIPIIIRTSGEVEALARSVDNSDDVYLVPAFAGLGAPHWNPHARGSVFGITRGITSAFYACTAGWSGTGLYSWLAAGDCCRHMGQCFGSFRFPANVTVTGAMCWVGGWIDGRRCRCGIGGRLVNRMLTLMLVP